MPHAPSIIEPRTPGLLSRGELQDYLNVGKNALPGIAERFNLAPVENHFPWRTIWRQILGLQPADEEEVALLREQLQPIDWVARRIGGSQSTVRTKVRGGTFDYPGPAVDLGRPGVASRSRRWIPAQIRAAIDGDTVPLFTPVEPIPRDPDGTAMPVDARPGAGGIAASHNAFAEMVRHNALKSRQRSK
jgi:hypothetical protein